VINDVSFTLLLAHADIDTGSLILFG